MEHVSYTNFEVTWPQNTMSGCPAWLNVNDSVEQLYLTKKSKKKNKDFYQKTLILGI